MTLLDAGALLVLLLRVTGILAVAWAVSRLRWSRSAALRHAVWLSALGACLAVPMMGAWVPSIDLPLPRIFAGSELVTTETSLPLVTSGSGPETGAPGPAEAARASRDADGFSGNRLPGLDWAGVAATVWLAGAVLRLGWLVLLHSRTRRLTNRARVLRGHARVQPLVDECARLLGLRAAVPILASPEVRMPLAWGVLRPVVLLPTDALRWTDERLRVVLLHELTHVRRRDYGTFLLSELVCVLYWPTPLVWLARRQLRIEQERACDDRVLSLGTPALAYADHILAIAREFYGSRWNLEVGVTMAREVSLKQRVRAILDERTDRRSFRGGGGLAVSVAALALYLPIGVVRGSIVEPVAKVSDVPVAEGVSDIAAADERHVYLWMEAEAGAGQRAYPAGDLGASDAEYILLDPAASRTAELRIEAALAAAGEYFIWARAATSDGPPRTLRIEINGGPSSWSGSAEVGTAGSPGGWKWLRMAADGASSSDTAEGARLTAGRNYFELTSAEHEVQVDRILVTDDPAYTPDAMGPVSSVKPTYLLLESEEGVRTGRLSNGDDPQASGNSFVVFRKGHGTKAPGAIEFNFEVPVAGRYLIWGRTYAKDAESNSFHVSLDDEAEVIWDLPAGDRRDPERLWTWDPVSARGDRRMDPLPFDMEAGRHALRIRTREGGAHLDALLITNDLGRRPDGLWPEVLPARPLQVELSPETASLSGPMVVMPAENERPYLVVDKPGRAKEPGGSGTAVFEFEAAETGLYSVWARTVAPSSDRDSFWIRVNGGEWVLWNGIPQSSDWSWAPVRDADAEGRLVQLHLNAGSHTLEIAGREGGLRLDRLLVTNDPLFQPS